MSEKDLDSFFSFLNDFSKPIQFTFAQSTSSVNFLDITLTITPTGVETTVFYKDTDSHSYLNYASSHPSACKDSIPFSQFLRLKRLCSKQQDFDEEASRMSSFFLHRGYPSHIVQKALNRASQVTRDQALVSHSKKQSDRIPLLLTFHPQSYAIHRIVQKNFSILQADEDTLAAFPSPPLLSFRRDRSLRDILVHSRISTPLTDPDIGTKPCRRPNCKTCAFVSSSRTVSFPQQTWTVSASYTCASSNLIYAIICKCCSSTYIGETGLRLSDRFGGHRRDIDQQALKPVAQHFNGPGHSGLRDVEVLVLRLCFGSKAQRKAIEQRLIFKMGTLSPHGMNSDHDFQ